MTQNFNGHLCVTSPMISRPSAEDSQQSGLSSMADIFDQTNEQELYDSEDRNYFDLNKFYYIEVFAFYSLPALLLALLCEWMGLYVYTSESYVSRVSLFDDELSSNLRPSPFLFPLRFSHDACCSFSIHLLVVRHHLPSPPIVNLTFSTLIISILLLVFPLMTDYSLGYNQQQSNIEKGSACHPQIKQEIAYYLQHTPTPSPSSVPSLIFKETNSPLQGRTPQEGRRKKTIRSIRFTQKITTKFGTLPEQYQGDNGILIPQLPPHSFHSEPERMEDPSVSSSQEQTDPHSPASINGETEQKKSPASINGETDPHSPASINGETKQKESPKPDSYQYHINDDFNIGILPFFPSTP